MAGVLYLTEQQAIDLFGLNLTAMRLLMVAGFARAIWRAEFAADKRNSVDAAVLLVYVYTALVFLIRSDSGHAQVLGWVVDATIGYFTFRSWLKSLEDLKWFLRVFVFLLAPYVALLVIEMHTRENPFSILGASLFE